jgi:23S rRNA (cytosine1962-C5)-methyltransferase
MAAKGLSVNEASAELLARGAPSLPITDLGDADGLEPGRPLRLLDRFGEVVATGVADPENGVVHVYARHALRALDGALIQARLDRSVSLRRALGLVDGGVSAYRLVNGEGDDLPGLWADVFGPYVVISAASGGLVPLARLLAGAVLASGGTPPLGVRGAVLKVRGKDPQDRRLKDEVIGERPPATLVVHELGIPYEVHLLGSLNVGLFCDMREHRRGIGRFVAGQRVLNTFAYTGALSVAAARAGARAVTSVDLSSGVLAWARENFRLSGLDGAEDAPRFRFEVSDVRRFMEKEREQGASYDTIILDPPTVSAARASQWSMKKDYPDLIALATKLFPPEGGFLWVSGNARRGPGVLRHVQEGLRRATRRGVLLELGGLPPDFPTPPDWPDSRYLEVCQLRISPA